jgi:hypothetical protein
LIPEAARLIDLESRASSSTKVHFASDASILASVFGLLQLFECLFQWSSPGSNYGV